MKKARCSICGQDFSSSGIRGHLRFKHGVENATNDDFKIIGEITTNEQETLPFDETYKPNPLFVKETHTRQTLDELERDMAQQLRIMNMQRMMSELRNPPVQQKSEFELFEKFINIQNKLKENIMDEMPEETITPEGLSFEEQMGLKLLDGFMNRKNQSPPSNDIMKEDKIMKPTKQDLEEAKQQIKEGKMTFEEMKEKVNQAYPNMFSEEQIKSEFEKIKNS